MIAESEQYKKC